MPPDISGKCLCWVGGIIGLEMGMFITPWLKKLMFLLSSLINFMPAADKDIVSNVHENHQNKFNTMLETKVTGIGKQKSNGLYVTFEGKQAPAEPVAFTTEWLVAVCP